MGAQSKDDLYKHRSSTTFLTAVQNSAQRLEIYKQFSQQ